MTLGVASGAVPPSLCGGVEPVDEHACGAVVVAIGLARLTAANKASCDILVGPHRWSFASFSLISSVQGGQSGRGGSRRRRLKFFFRD